MIQPIADDVLTDIVRRARCAVCNGLGFRRARAQDEGGTSIDGAVSYVDCRECHGHGIHLGVCRRLAREYSGKP